MKLLTSLSIAKTAEVRDRLSANLPTLPRPELALVHLDANDMNGSIDSGIVEPMCEIVTLLRKANPQVKVLVAQIPLAWRKGLTCTTA